MNVFIFRKISYPDYFIDKCVYFFINKSFIKKPLSYDVLKKKIAIVLPYLGKLSLEIRKRLVNMLLNIPCCKLQFIFRSKRRLRKILHFKDTPY